MSQVDKLLDSLTDEELAAYGTTSESEPHIVIGSNRRIIIPEQLKRIAVQYDHDVETVIFDCPRYWDNHDMSAMAIYINYMRSDGYADSYPADNVTVDGDIMHFSWTISRNVTEVQGNISFLVCVKNTDAEGNEINHWNSELSTGMYVSEGMETEEQVLEFYPDLVTQLLLRMDSVEKINIQASEMNSLLASTEEAKDAAENARDIVLAESDYIKNSYANAIKGSKKGEIIQVDDVSPIEHDVECKVRGKNFLDVSILSVGTVSTTAPYISNVAEGSITISTKDGHDGNGYKHVGHTLKELCPQIVAGRTYVINAESAASNKGVYLVEEKILWLFGEALTLTDEMINCNVGFYGFHAASDGFGDCTISNIQLEEGSVATEYEPYIDPTTVTVTGCGKNLIPYPYTDTTKTQNGITFTDNGDGSITINGTATEPAYFFLQRDANYGGIINSILTDNANNGVYTASKRLYYNASTKTLTVNINTGTVISNEKIYPQLEAGLVATKYEPYTGTTYTPSSDGTVDIASVSPTMTIFTDTPGVIVEAEYNRDTTKAMTSYIFTEEIKQDIADIVEEDLSVRHVKIANGSTITLQDNCDYYSDTPITSLTIKYPSGDFISSVSFTLADSGTISITLPDSKYIGGELEFANGETWELNIKNGVVVGGLVE